MLSHPHPTADPAHLLALLRRLLNRFANRVRPRTGWWLGPASRVTIAPAGWCGYALKIHRNQGVEWIDLPRRNRVYDRPDEHQLRAVCEALAERRLTWVLPWGLDSEGNLTAPVTPLVRKENGQ
ncbi:hypothetical protein [Couchioplanes caeruleus]|uniref:Uncharacterized protein n=2 Tax=Couchioplanes caeruleus TaxID=56438 RepID=A0A1K0FAB7_9ACTN|nr:hypothetical protein [Couchioplanes caeruleus]OJF09785.1 hypothetical protein BG844_35525 [Couchioplanes caeruleus subsp. caeruleus]ROP31438.1 hypothetical protein EDD30_4340 [Couchioplanes caeruleus]